MLEAGDFIISRNVFAHNSEGETVVSEEGLLTTWSHGAKAQRESKPGVVAYTWDPSTWEVKVRGSEIQSSSTTH